MLDSNLTYVVPRNLKGPFPFQHDNLDIGFCFRKVIGKKVAATVKQTIDWPL